MHVRDVRRRKQTNIQKQKILIGLPEAYARFSPSSPVWCWRRFNFTSCLAHFSASDASFEDHFNGGAPCWARYWLCASKLSFWNWSGMAEKNNYMNNHKKKLNDDKKWNTANQSNHRDEKTNKDCRRVKPRIYISNRVGRCRSGAIGLKAAEVRTVFCDMKVFYGNDHVFSKASTSPSAVWCWTLPKIINFGYW